jgi:predicted GIY-YIG superfamily endonuclease
MEGDMASIPQHKYFYQKSGVYLIHLDTKMAHSQHYIGYADSVAKRVKKHGTSEGARMLQVARQRGITFRLVREWWGADRRFERKLKRRKKSSQLCPICNPMAYRYGNVAGPIGKDIPW